MPGKPETVETTYEILSGEDSDRVCEAIPDQACNNIPRNYLLNVLNGASTKLAEQLAGPNLVLPWLLSTIGTPHFLTSLLMPLKQAGSLIPQLAVAGVIRGYKTRKWFWVGAGISQAIFLLLMIAAVLVFKPLAAGISVLVLLFLFSAASGVGSVAFKDVVGKTIDKGIRGRMLANRAVIGGILTVGAGLILKFYIGESSEITSYLILIGIAVFLWLLGSLFFALKEEYAGATEGGRNALEEAKAGFKIFKKDSNYRQYLGSRFFLVTIEISAPFFVIHSKEVISNGIQSLGILVASVGIANILSSPFWGKLADTESRKTMFYSGLIGTLAAILALLFYLIPSDIQTPYLYGVVFIVLGISIAGVRLGRKTYLIDYLDDKERPTYVAFANSTIGIITIGLGALLGLLVEYVNIELFLFIFIGMSLLGSFTSLKLSKTK